ncbi:hypothetical protein EST38_g5057 [Candolleomyces aberdarensis]|uniref:Uncharacterized protein n=1 Tax=Candolleomyces aberdarensis TaxID=2316362 RepID=A0A4Q2DNP1_9AGAR|nr:hypothetical protein EST38_g5057 [Candolleomyces aberdarensis]
MQFTSSFAVLAVVVANSFVNATPIPRTDLVVREPSMDAAAPKVQQLSRRAYHEGYLEARDFLNALEDYMYTRGTRY